jgi:hypothetical protein
MISWMRRAFKSKKSQAVVWISLLAIFIYLGMADLFRRLLGPTDWVLSINDTKISRQEFEQKVDAQRRQLDMYKKYIPDLARTINPRDMAKNAIINETLTNEIASKLDIQYDPLFVKEAIFRELQVPGNQGIDLQEISSWLGIHLSKSTLLLAIVILFLEGVMFLLQLIFHAHFWIKQYNLLYSVIISGEIIACIGIIFLTPPSLILFNVFLIKIISCIITIILALILLVRFYKKYDKNAHQEVIDYYKLRREFIKHSSVMWVNTLFKSLTERNFVIPILTHTLGAPFANIFKISNDVALLFQRSIMKTIGTTDTSLFTFAKQISADHKTTLEAFNKILRKIFYLVGLVSAFLIIFIIFKDFFIRKSGFIIDLFAILVTAYLIEALLSPYERVLEVNRRYKILLLAYVPFVIFAILLSVNNLIPNIGLVGFLIVLCSVRILSSLIIFICSRKLYGLKISKREK